MPRITLTVNGAERTAEAPAAVTLLDFLRDYLDLTGTKPGCEEGVCGACTVLVDGRAVRSCRITAQSAASKRITTIEGLKHPVQDAFLAAEAYQCGYCTPGMIVEAAALLDERGALTRDTVRRRMQGHICRCGMYNEVIDAVMQVVKRV